jgi:ubiquinone/menaquinone biosynthesis C-methylase UbiE
MAAQVERKDDVVAAREIRIGPSQQDPAYVLGHDEAELARLSRQAVILNQLTEPLLRQAGLVVGMRVCDVGCAAGDMTFLVADMVGPTGAVVGLDRSADALATARARAKQANRTNVEFVERDLGTADLDLPEASFDAITGRAVLYVLKDPVSILRLLARYVRPGGLMLFHEFDFTLAGLAWPPSPLWQTIGHWWREVQLRAGLEPQMGLKLHSAFVQAGLPAPQLRNDNAVDGGPQSPFYDWIAATTHSIVPALAALGVATPGRVAIETLEDRLRAEVVAGGGMLLSPPLIGAWTRLPD